MTFTILMHPAFSLTYKVEELNCPYQVHQHTESCYTEVETQEGEKEKILTCGQADYVIHEHNDDCCKDGALICSLPEIPNHQHTDSCYTEEKELTCGQQELHTHREKCYDNDGQLICGLLGLEEHVHDTKCFTERDMTAEEVSEMNAIEQETTMEVPEETTEQDQLEKQHGKKCSGQ